MRCAVAIRVSWDLWTGAVQSWSSGVLGSHVGSSEGFPEV